MKIKKIIYEIPGTMNISALDPAHLHSLKIFSLPIWLIAISISLSFTAKPVRAGTEDMHQYFRYIPYEGPKSTTGTDSQRPKQAPGANESEAKKAQTGEQAPGTGQKTESGEQAKKPSETTGTAPMSKGEEVKKTESGEQTMKPGETTGIAPMSKSEEVKKTEPSEQIKKPGETTGTAPMSKGEEAKKTEPSEQTTKPSESSGTGPTGSGQAPASGSQATTSSQNTQQSPLTKESSTTSAVHAGQEPSFSQIDKDGDHYVTKDELKDFPELLRAFDKVDAGKDGRLEQHEFQNLEMETKREGEVP